MRLARQSGYEASSRVLTKLYQLRMTGQLNLVLLNGSGALEQLMKRNDAHWMRLMVDQLDLLTWQLNQVRLVMSLCLLDQVRLELIRRASQHRVLNELYLGLLMKLVKLLL